EFLPVSSSGHLALAGHFLGLDKDALEFLAIWVHAATLGAVACFYWRETLGLAGLIVPPLRRLAERASAEDGASAGAAEPAPMNWAYAWALILGTLPAVA